VTRIFERFSFRGSGERARRGSLRAALIGALFALILVPVARAAIPPPRNALVQARAGVDALARQASSSSGERLVADAARQLARAVVPTLWIDAHDAVAPAYGARVFADSVAALSDLQRVARSSESPQSVSAITALVVRADRDLAQGVIRQARGGNHQLLVTAGRELVAGAHEASGGHLVSAVRSYAAAWESAFHALTELVAAQATSVPPAALATAAEDALGSKPIGLAGPMIQNGEPPLTVAGKPEVFFAGVEPCPFCAVQRWGLIVALSQFGTFSNLHLMQSVPEEPPVVRSFTFFGSRYHSPYISLVPVEVLSNVPSGFGFAHLQRLTHSENALVNRFDPSSQTPFIDVANRFIRIDSTVQPTLVGGMSWTQITSSLRHPASIAAQAIGGEAEVLTAELCEVTNGNPASVCSTPVVKQYQAALPFLNGNGGGCPATMTIAAVRAPRATEARCHT
jgi:uncharacterized protein DUF929